MSHSKLKTIGWTVALGLKTLYTLGRYLMPAMVWGIAMKVGMIQGGWPQAAISIALAIGAIIAMAMSEV